MLKAHANTVLHDLTGRVFVHLSIGLVGQQYNATEVLAGSVLLWGMTVVRLA
jgi:hypothetical protein